MKSEIPKINRTALPKERLRLKNGFALRTLSLKMRAVPGLADWGVLG